MTSSYMVIQSGFRRRGALGAARRLRAGPAPVRACGITGDGNTSIFGVARPRTHSTGRCRAFRGQRRPAPACARLRSASGGQGGLPGAGPSGKREVKNLGKS